MDAVLEAKHLTKNYAGYTALDKVDIDLKRGDIYGLIGENGAGKTTLFKLFAGLLFPNGGEMRLFGDHGSQALAEQRRRLGFIIEQPGFYPELSVERNLEYYRLQKGVPGRQVVSQLLETVGLSHASKKRGKELSLGMKQRLGLAIALLGEPEVLVLDEPITGLDPSGIADMRKLLLTLNQEKNITILISSHNLPELEQLATVYGFISKGKMLEQVSAKQLQERCASYIDINVSDPQRYAALLESLLGHTQYQVLPNAIIRIFDPAQSIEVFSRLAQDQGMDIYSLERMRMSLENYYFELKEKGVA